MPVLGIFFSLISTSSARVLQTQTEMCTVLFISMFYLGISPSYSKCQILKCHIRLIFAALSLVLFNRPVKVLHMQKLTIAAVPQSFPINSFWQLSRQQALAAVPSSTAPCSCRVKSPLQLPCHLILSAFLLQKLLTAFLLAARSCPVNSALQLSCQQLITAILSVASNGFPVSRFLQLSCQKLLTGVLSAVNSSYI